MLKNKRWYKALSIVIISITLILMHLHASKHVSILFYYSTCDCGNGASLIYFLDKNTVVQRIDSPASSDLELFYIPRIGGFSSTAYRSLDSIFLVIKDFSGIDIAQKKVKVNFMVYKCLTISCDAENGKKSVRIEKEVFCRDIKVQ